MFPLRLRRAEALAEVGQALRAGSTPVPPLSSVEFLGEMSDVLRSRAPLPLIPPAPFSHNGRRGSLGVLMAETGDGTQGLAKKSTPVRVLPRNMARITEMPAPQGLPRAQGGLEPACAAVVRGGSTSMRTAINAQSPSARRQGAHSGFNAQSSSFRSPRVA